jgi:hypothetical protein
MPGGRKQGRCLVGIGIDQASVGEEERRTELEMAKIRNLTHIFRAEREREREREREKERAVMEGSIRLNTSEVGKATALMCFDPRLMS